MSNPWEAIHWKRIPCYHVQVVNTSGPAMPLGPLILPNGPSIFTWYMISLNIPWATELLHNTFPEPCCCSPLAVFAHHRNCKQRVHPICEPPSSSLLCPIDTKNFWSRITAGLNALAHLNLYISVTAVDHTYRSTLIHIKGRS